MTFYFRAGKITRGLSNETQLTSVEEKAENALEVAQETDATRKTDAETKTVNHITLGAWCNPASLRAPVRYDYKRVI